MKNSRRSSINDFRVLCSPQCFREGHIHGSLTISFFRHSRGVCLFQFEFISVLLFSEKLFRSHRLVHSHLRCHYSLSSCIYLYAYLLVYLLLHLLTFIYLFVCQFIYFFADRGKPREKYVSNNRKKEQNIRKATFLTGNFINYAKLSGSLKEFCTSLFLVKFDVIGVQELKFTYYRRSLLRSLN